MSKQSESSSSSMRMNSKVLRAITSEVGAPLYIYDIMAVENELRKLDTSYRTSGIKNTLKIYFPLFVNTNSALVSRILRLRDDFGLFVNCKEELMFSLKSLHLDSEDILFGGGITSHEDLDYVSKQGVLVAAASLVNLEHLCRLDSTRELAIRVDLTGAALKGIRYYELDTAFEIAAQYRKPIIQLQAYPGTNILWEDHLLRHAQSLLRLWQDHPEVRMLNFSGGFGYDYAKVNGRYDFSFSTYFQGLQRLLDEYSLPEDIMLAIEPGRRLMASSGYLIVKVIETRRVAFDRRDICVDSSFTHLPSAKIHHQMHEVVPLTADFEPKQTDEVFNCRIAGTTTLSTDLLLPEEVLLPDMKQGEYLAICDVGAYGRVAGYNFLGRPLPPEVLLTDSGALVIRKRQEPTTYMDATREERLGGD